jgi:hypothetical protein
VSVALAVCRYFAALESAHVDGDAWRAIGDGLAAVDQTYLAGCAYARATECDGAALASLAADVAALISL